MSGPAPIAPIAPHRAPVGVVVPAWNRAALVTGCLDGVLRQDVLPQRLVVVDDGSDDGTADTVARWIEQGPRGLSMQLVRGPRRGAAAARNAGLALLEELPYVAFLDSDDRWPPDFLARTVTALAADAGAAAASVDRLRVDLEEDTRTRDDLADLARAPIPWFFRYGAGIGSATLFRTAAVRAAGGYPEDVATGHDVALFCRVAPHGRWLHCPGEPATFLRRHARRSGDADHVFVYCADHELGWARLYDALAAELGPALLPRRVRRRTLSRRWREAGEAQLRAGRPRGARDCFGRAVRLHPGRASHWTGYLRALLSRSER